MEQRADADRGAADRHLWEMAWGRDLVLLAVIGLLLWLAVQVRGILLPLLLAWGLAYLFNPVFVWAHQHWRLPRMVTLVLVLVLFGIVGGGFVGWLGPLLWRQTIALVSELPHYLQRLATEYGVQLGTVAEQAERISEGLQEEPMGMLRSLLTGSGRLFGLLGNLIGSTMYVVFALTLWLVFFIYFCLAYPRLMDWLRSMVPASRRARVWRLAGRMDRAVGGFFRSRVLAKIIVGFLFAAGWWLAGVPYWFVLGLLAGLLNLVPLAALACLPLAVLLRYLDLSANQEVATFGWTAWLLWPTVVYLVVQGLDEWLVAPLLGAKGSNLSMMTVLLVALVGVSVGGIWGVLLAVPLAACLKVLMQAVFLPRWRHWAARH